VDKLTFSGVFIGENSLGAGAFEPASAQRLLWKSL
jgi:hypothetical protein